MQPVDNFSAPRVMRRSVSASACRPCRVRSGVAIHPSGDLSAIAGTTSSVGWACLRRGLHCGVSAGTSHIPTGAFLQRSGRQL